MLVTSQRSSTIAPSWGSCRLRCTFVKAGAENAPNLTRPLLIANKGSPSMSTPNVQPWQGGENSSSCPFTVVQYDQPGRQGIPHRRRPYSVRGPARLGGRRTFASGNAQHGSPIEFRSG